VRTNTRASRTQSERACCIGTIRIIAYGHCSLLLCGAWGDAVDELIPIAVGDERSAGTVIFVHGLNGDPFKTWGGVEASSPHFWPKWLAGEPTLASISIYALRYEAHPSALAGVSMSLFEYGKSALARLKSAPQLLGAPLAFVCHSLGGLVIKQMISEADADRANEVSQLLLDRIAQVVFIATPHQGANLPVFINKWAWFAYRPSVVLRHLEHGNKILLQLGSWYTNFNQGRPTKHLVFWETKKTNGIKIVTDESAQPGVPAEYVPIAANHINIAKPHNRSDLLYTRIRLLLETLSTSRSRVDELNVLREVHSKTEQRLVETQRELEELRQQAKPQVSSSTVEEYQRKLEEAESRWAELHKTLAEAQTAPAVAPTKEFLDKPNTLTPSIVRIDTTGGFLMGGPATDDGIRTNEKPYHPVAFARAFALGVCPVTVGEWNYAIDYGFPAERVGGPDSLPVTGVTWDGARLYAGWLSIFTGVQYRLPSEAEWEYVCRARTITKYYFGDQIEYGQANFNAKYLNSGNSGVAVGLMPAKSYTPNAFGAYNMHGNVWEWVEDDYHSSYVNAPNDGSAWIDWPRRKISRSARRLFRKRAPTTAVGSAGESHTQAARAGQGRLQGCEIRQRRVSREIFPRLRARGACRPQTFC
jgi:formylglycine-generating enzyme required for sulfatase activity